MERDYLAEALKRANSEEGKRLMRKIRMCRTKKLETEDGPTYDEFMSIMQEGLPDIEEKFAKIEDEKATKDYLQQELQILKLQLENSTTNDLSEIKIQIKLIEQQIEYLTSKNT